MRRAAGPVTGKAVSGYSPVSLEMGNGKMLPKKGRIFPRRADRWRHDTDYSTAISTALRQELGDTHQATKTVMRWTGASERTIKNWLAGTSGPHGEHLISLVHHSDAVFEALLRTAGRESLLPVIRLANSRRALTEIRDLLSALLARAGDDLVD
jgi:hypothetical protein